LTRLLVLAGDPDPMVRFQLAFSLGTAKDDPRAIAALATIAARDAGSVWARRHWSDRAKVDLDIGRLRKCSITLEWA